MEETTNSTFFTFDSPKGQSAYIKVIGVGGGGGNAVNHMFRQGIKGVDFIVCNTDMKALAASPVPNKISLGDLGLGAGNKPERARRAAEEKADDIREAISHNTQMLFITAGMGGGTGTGAAPVIAQIAKSIDLDNEDTKKILVVAIVTLPFSREGRRRREQAEAGIVELSKYVDSILVINNDKLLSFRDFTLSRAFGMANDVLLTAAKGIAEIITVDAYVNIDFQDVNTVMEQSGTALMGVGVGKGENRALDAIAEATTSVLLNDNDIRGAKNVLIYYSYNPEHELTMTELDEISDYVDQKTDGSADVIWGAGADESLDDELKVTLIATGFDKKAVIPENPTVISLGDDKPKAITPTDSPKPDDDGMMLIQKRQPVEEKKPEVTATEQPKPQAEKHIIPLEEEVPAEKPATGEMVQHQPKSHDVLVADIHIVPKSETREPQGPAAVAPQPAVVAPVATPAPAPRPQPAATRRSPFESDLDCTTAAERIRHIHDMLRNDADGAEKVARMTTAELTSDGLYDGVPSSAREASTTRIRPNGTLEQNVYVFTDTD